MNALREAIASAVDGADWIKVEDGSGEDVAVLVEEAIRSVLPADLLLMAAVALVQDERRFADSAPEYGPEERRARNKDLTRAIEFLSVCVRLHAPKAATL